MKTWELVRHFDKEKLRLVEGYKCEAFQFDWLLWEMPKNQLAIKLFLEV